MASFGKLAAKVVDWFAALAVVVMTLLVFFQVANRYMIGWIVPWTEEVSRILFIWITFVGHTLPLKRIPTLLLKPSSSVSLPKTGKKFRTF